MARFVVDFAAGARPASAPWTYAEALWPFAKADLACEHHPRHSRIRGRINLAQATAEATFKAYASVAVYTLTPKGSRPVKEALTAKDHSVSLTAAVATDAIIVGGEAWRYWSPDALRLAELVREDFNRIERAASGRPSAARVFPHSLFGPLWPGRRPTPVPPDPADDELESQFESGALGHLQESLADADANSAQKNRAITRVVIGDIGDAWRAWRREMYGKRSKP